MTRCTADVALCGRVRYATVRGLPVVCKGLPRTAGRGHSCRAAQHRTCQVAVLAACRKRLAQAGVATAVPSFQSLRALQDKVSASATLEGLGGCPNRPIGVFR
jgi:hypothetical protein